MKKLVWIFCAALLAVSAPACRTKEGCQATESLKPSYNQKGEPKRKKGKKKAEMGLFSKKMQKKMKK